MFPAAANKRNIVIERMVKSGWTVTDDPFLLLAPLKYAEGSIDLGKERVLAAERDGTKIAVRPVIDEMYFIDGSLGGLLGEALLYAAALEDNEPNRRFYIAIDRINFEGRFLHSSVISRVIKRGLFSFLIYSEDDAEAIELID